MAFLGFAFILCAVLVAGLPPLSGFVAKLAMLSALLSPVTATGGAVGAGAWALAAMVVMTGLAALVSLSRAGVRYFWAPQDRPPPTLRLAEGVPVAALLAACVALTWHAEPVLGYTRAIARSLHHPQGYIDAVMSARPIPGPTRAGRGAQ
jgi:multicomponent K+:H+ antiporter subunit D